MNCRKSTNSNHAESNPAPAPRSASDTAAVTETGTGAASVTAAEADTAAAHADRNHHEGTNIMKKKKRDNSVVKSGGIAPQQADTEDVTRDTYGYAEAEPIAQKRDERVAEADRTASALGLPGADVPEASTSDESTAKRRAEEYRRAEVAGDRTAPPQDVEKLRARRRGGR
jgi:hypothetical protein